MRACIFLMTIGAFFAVSAPVRADDPKFAQLKTNGLLTTPAPDLKGGILFKGGALDLSDKPEAMIIANLNFPEGVRFIHVKMIYHGEYTDPNTNIPGYLYHLKGQAYDRYFFVSKMGIPGAPDSQRYIIDYNLNGNPLAYFRGTFIAKP